MSGSRSALESPNERIAIKRLDLSPDGDAIFSSYHFKFDGHMFVQ